MKLLTDREVAEIFGHNRMWPWERARNEPGFPKPIKISHKTTRWRHDEIVAYIESKAAAR